MIEQDLDYGGTMATFKMINGGEVMYLTIFNDHNGYYSNAFEFKAGETMIKDGYL